MTKNAQTAMIAATATKSTKSNIKKLKVYLSKTTK